MTRRKEGLSLLLMVPIIFASLVLLERTTYAAEQKKPLESITLRLGSIMHKDHPHSDAVLKMASMMDERTKGRVKIIYYPHSELGDAVQQISGVRSGAQDIWNGANGQMARTMPAFNVLSPGFAYSDKDAKRAFLRSNFFMELREELRKKFGLLMLTNEWFRGYRELFTLAPVKKLEDLKGLKLRTPPSPSKILAWQKLGAAPTPTAAGEVYMALKEKVIEGCELDLYSIRSNRYDEICKYATLTGHEAVFASIVINEKVWNRISKDDQKTMLDVIKECGEWVEKKWESGITSLIASMEKEEKVTFIRLSSEERDRWLKIGQQAFQELEEKKWWPAGTVKKIIAKEPDFYKR